jgi:hypothetical protein
VVAAAAAVEAVAEVVDILEADIRTCLRMRVYCEGFLHDWEVFRRVLDIVRKKKNLWQVTED